MVVRGGSDQSKKPQIMGVWVVVGRRLVSSAACRVRTEGEDDDDGVDFQVLPEQARLLFAARKR